MAELVGVQVIPACAFGLPQVRVSGALQPGQTGLDRGVAELSWKLQVRMRNCPQTAIRIARFVIGAGGGGGHRNHCARVSLNVPRVPLPVGGRR